ncbi:MAG: DNA alkylation repair protein, partial [Actinomycetota bacterium]|nr:DNA alkylation repair protein [Actinomycetota bacterium]
MPRSASGRSKATHRDAAAPPELEGRRGRARELGRALGAALDDPDALSGQLRAALVELSDEPYRQELKRVAPGIAHVIGVRNPLIGALIGGLRPALRRARPAEALFVAERLSRQDELELRQVSLAFLRRSLADDPERTWQLMRRLGRRAADWISVDSLARLFGEGILREPFRWAEIEQLVYAESAWERRLAAATVAVLRSIARELAARGVIAQRLGPAAVTRGLDVLGSLLGDA